MSPHSQILPARLTVTVGGQQHLAPADCAQAASNGCQTELELQVGGRLALFDLTGELHATVVSSLALSVLADLDLLLGGQGVAGGAVHIGNNTTSAGVTVNNSLVALVLDDLTYVVQNSGSVDLVDAAVCHRGVLVELGAFFDTTLYASGNTEGKADDAFCVGEETAGIHLGGSTLESGHGANAAQVCACFKGRFFDHFAG